MDYNRQSNSKKSGFGTDEVSQLTRKRYERLEIFESGETVLNSNVETTDLDASTPKRQKLTDKLTEKMVDKSMEILNSKPEERKEADEDIFGKMIDVTLIRINAYQKITARKIISDILFEIELSD